MNEWWTPVDQEKNERWGKEVQSACVERWLWKGTEKRTVSWKAYGIQEETLFFNGIYDLTALTIIYADYSLN
jgi:hypothetical protein